MSYFIKNILNNILFPLRKRIKISRPINNIPNEDKTKLFTEKNESDEEKRLIKTYNLALFRDNSKIITYKENLYCLKLLEDNLKNIDFNWQKDTLNLLDIGSRNFSYATSLHNFFSYYKTVDTPKREIYLDGIEIDPYRLMADLHSRFDYAQYHIKNLSNTRYITSDFLDFNEKKYDIILWFLPFIIKKPLLNWGLPLKHLKPEQMLKHAYEILNPGGIILVVNQLKKEKDYQLEIIKDLGLNYIDFEDSYTNLFSPFAFERYITIIKNDEYT